jgi:hypothetical protein
MKFAMMIDSYGVPSYYVDKGIAYGLYDDKPLTINHGVSPECFMALQNYTFLWSDTDKGYFINMYEHLENGKDLPDIDLDFILLGYNKIGLDELETNNFWNVDRIKNKYNAKVVGLITELWSPFSSAYDYEHIRFVNRNKFLDSCDDATVWAVDGMKNLEVFRKINESLENNQIKYLNPIQNLEYLYNNFYSNEKQNSIYAYISNPINRRGTTYQFADYLGQKYNLPVIKKPLHEGQKFDHLNQQQFLDLWTPHLFHFNLDPSRTQPGNQGILVAAVGSINLGGVNESHDVLFPDTATNDWYYLEQKFVQLCRDSQARQEILEYAWEKLHKTYSFDVARKQIEELCNV